MKTKLTLLLDKATIEEAKEYAAVNNTSLSQMFEQFLRSTFRRKKSSAKKIEVSDYVKSLSTNLEIPKAYDLKKEYAKHVAKRYGS